PARLRPHTTLFRSTWSDCSRSSSFSSSRCDTTDCRGLKVPAGGPRRVSASPAHGRTSSSSECVARTRNVRGHRRARQGGTMGDEVRDSGHPMMAKAKELLHEGKVRRITVKDDHDKLVVAVPLAVGVVAFLAAPVVTAAGALAAVAARWTIDVERPGEEES